jgi:hypothetical protein
MVIGEALALALVGVVLGSAGGVALSRLATRRAARIQPMEAVRAE